ncbi:MAG: S-methyl-5'-thioadenosine phosphorylase [Desulfobacterales bacterium]|nr:S-methyl-5'-thioadenosine phosphorylase [Desulfobacterales bacterium]
MSQKIKVGIIGGSGLNDPHLLHNEQIIDMDTPYGKPSSGLSIGQIQDVDVVILARHGKQHQYSPTQVNYRANIHALKMMNVTHIIATTACGSLKEDIAPGHFVIIDQFIDFTKHRKMTFFESFEKGIVHTSMADPFDPSLRKMLYETTKELGYPVHPIGTVVTIEGPRFSTRAESKMFRLWGADIINMSIATEAMLAKETEIPYAAIAMSTDYDCWKEHETAVTWQEILDVFHRNAENVKKILVQVISKFK